MHDYKKRKLNFYIIGKTNVPRAIATKRQQVRDKKKYSYRDKRKKNKKQRIISGRMKEK